MPGLLAGAASTFAKEEEEEEAADEKEGEIAVKKEAVDAEELLWCTLIRKTACKTRQRYDLRGRRRMRLFTNSRTPHCVVLVPTRHDKLRMARVVLSGQRSLSSDDFPWAVVESSRKAVTFTWNQGARPNVAARPWIG